MRRHLSYANVVATLALVFAMSGGALAAKHYLINSTKQISPKVLKKLRGATGRPGRAGATGPGGKEGAAGSRGGNGTNGERGPSAAFSSGPGSGVEFPLTANEAVTVATVALPAGSFSLTAKLLVNNNAGTASVRCELLAGGIVVDPAENVLTLAASAPGDRAYYVLSGDVSLTSPGEAVVNCSSTTNAGNYVDHRITAIQVGSIG